MLKVSYGVGPFYSGLGINEPCKKDLEIVFEEDATSVEILSEFIKCLYFAGYSRFDKKYFEDLSEELLSEGIIDE